MPPLLTEQLAQVPDPEAWLFDRFADDPVALAAAVHDLGIEAGVVADLNRYRWRGGAARLMDTTDDEVLLSGPAGTGKSVAALYRILDLCTHNPGTRALMVRKTAKSLAASALVTWRERVAVNSLRSGAMYFYGGSAAEPAQYRLWNGSRIMLGGMDNADKVMSTEYDLIYAQEAIELTDTDWEKLTTRLRNGILPHMQLLADTNPSTPTHWLKARCDRGACRIIESRHEDNPSLYDDAGQLTPEGATYLGRLDRLTGPRLQRLRYGRWVSAEGTIYETWDDAIHLVDRFPIPPAWPRYLAVDFGFTNPFTCQWWAEDPDGRLYLYRELYRTQRLVEDHARDIARLSKGEPEPVTVICDHDAEDRATLERHLGRSTDAAHKAVRPGIEAVQARLRLAGDGRPRLFVLRDSLVGRDPHLAEATLPCCLGDELPGYVWAPPTATRPAKDEPLKVNDHACDAMRYVVAQVDLVGRPRMRWL